MLDINFIRQNPDVIKKGIEAKKVNPALVDDFLEIDNKWKELIKNSEKLKFEQKKIGKDNIDEAKKIKAEIQKFEKQLKEVEDERQEILKLFPNLPLANVPIGKDEKENVVIREVGDKPKFNFQPKDYLEIAEKLDLIDIERAGKVSGSRFGYLKNQAALLEFALIKLAFDTLLKEDFIPVVPPVMVKKEMMWAMGYIDSKKDLEERYFFEKDKLFLVGTSEQSIVPMHADEIFNEKELPKRYLGFSSCFRREAGSYGRDTKGILRVHQFDKLEMVSFAHPENSYSELELFLKIEEALMQKLRIPYRVVQLCSGDLARPLAITYDIESWLPGQNNGKGQYRETHSCSSATDFQARRLNIKYKAQSNETHFVHTLNGTAFAIGRTLIAIFENYQQKDGSVLVPEVLQKYLGFDKISHV